MQSKIAALMLLGLVMGGAYAQLSPNALVVKQPPRLTSEISQGAIDLNQADLKSLLSLKGIGKKRAAAIIAYRQQHGAFKSVNELAEVKGFNQKQLVSLFKNNQNRIMVRNNELK